MGTHLITLLIHLFFFLYLFCLLLCREQMFSFLCCNDVGDAILIVLITLISAGSERTVK